MTASGTKWTCDSFQSMTAFGDKADIRHSTTYVLICTGAMHRRAALCRIYNDFVVFGG